MDTMEEAANATLWERCRVQLVTAAARGTDAIAEVTETLIAQWCIDAEQMQQILIYAIRRGDLADHVLQSGEMHLTPLSKQVHGVAPVAASAGGSRSSAPVSPAGARSNALPESLASYALTIGEYTRKKGCLALRIGRELWAARKECERSQCSFPAFLTHLNEQHGMHPKTSYLYMQYCEWSFPDGLGSAVMKWIVGGFVRGSREAAEVVSAASREGATLAELKARYGALRACQRTTLDSMIVSKSSTSVMIQRLEKDRQRLLSKRVDIDSQLASLELQLRKLRSRAPQEGNEILLDEPRDQIMGTSLLALSGAMLE